MKARIEIRQAGERPFKTWGWKLYDLEGKVMADGYWLYISKLAAKRAALRAKKAMAEAEIKNKGEKE